jgi:protease I
VSPAPPVSAVAATPAAALLPRCNSDLENAGATWVDQDVVVDGNLITSRKPDDLDAFCDAVLRALDR